MTDMTAQGRVIAAAEITTGADVLPAAFTANGEPLNLAAAAYDALEWLQWLERATERGLRMDAEERRRLRCCERSLAGFLAAHLPEQYAPPVLAHD